jgi:hypothetical protein
VRLTAIRRSVQNSGVDIPDRPWHVVSAVAKSLVSTVQIMSAG